MAHAKPSTIQNPTQLVDEFKKSGEFDRLRRELLAQFQKGESIETFMTRVDEITREKLAASMNRNHKSQDTIHAELMQEMERYPLVERAVADHATLANPAFVESIHTSVTQILKASRGQRVAEKPYEKPPPKSTTGNASVKPNGRKPTGTSGSPAAADVTPLVALQVVCPPGESTKHQPAPSGNSPSQESHSETNITVGVNSAVQSETSPVNQLETAPPMEVDEPTSGIPSVPPKATPTEGPMST